MTDETSQTPLLDLIANMTAESLESSNLDVKTLMLVRIAALVAVDAPAASYMMNLGVASESGVDVDQVQGVLTAVAPIVGGPRVTAAVGHIAEALGLAIDLGQASTR
jgi:alkylhydroperoxidase/carboxymuconolactone decarboxylase family protein YurZ